MANQNENQTLSYAGQFQSDGGAIDLTVPFQPDALMLYNYTAYGTAGDNVENIWFRGFPAADALVKTVIVDDGTGTVKSSDLVTSNGVTENNTAAGVTSSKFAISGATAADPVVVTTAAHGVTVGEQVRVSITGVVGMTELNDIGRNPFLATALTSTTLSLQDLDGNDIDGSAFTSYTSGGTLNILTHLTGASKGPVLYADDVYKLTLGTSVVNDDDDIIYFVAWKFGQFVDLGDQA